MVKPTFERKFLKNHLQFQNGLLSRFLANRRMQQMAESSARPAYAAELRVEGIEGIGNISDSPTPASKDTERPLPQPRKSHPPNLPPEPPPPSDEIKQAKPWRWSLVWLASLCVLGGMGTAALIWLVSLPPQVDCRQPEKLSLDMERLYCAQEAAQTGDLSKLIAGIEMLKQWQPDHPLYRESQRLIQDWSDQVLTIATKKVVQGDLKGAEAAISHIPNTTPVYADAQKSIARWRKYSKTASEIYDKAQAALKQKDWNVVSQQIVALAEFERDYWTLEKGSNAVAQQLGMEKQAWQILSRAQKMAASGNLKQVSAAIPVAQAVPAKTYAAETAKANLKQWSQKLVTIGSRQWQQGDRNGALATLSLAAQIKITPETEDLYRFGNAYRLASSAIGEKWLPSVAQVLNLMEAIAAIEQVTAASPFYTQAQTLKQNWQTQLQDLIQLKYASSVASLGQRSTLALAIGQAKQLDPERPRRIHAQSLVASWQRETERLEDQPILDRAVQISKTGGIEALQAAIQQASQVQLGRALRTQSQTWIAMWRSQIQTLEDQPTLDQAWALARQGKLNEAIQTASAIQSGRSLYRDAQSAIGEWRYQQIVDAQVAQDQPILNRATALANGGNLAAAISVASQIGSGRALSGQAQAAIERWETQLRPPAPEPQTPPNYDAYAPALDDLPSELPGEEWPFRSPPPSAEEPFSNPVLQPGELLAPTLESPASPLPSDDPFPQPTEPSLNLAPAPPVEPAPVPPVYEPVPPVDPLPPEPVDPLPPSF
jgi:hypothetical protein